MEINILMMGGRRAGKTSILAAVDECCTKTLVGNENIKINVKLGGSQLHVKQTELKMYFLDPRYIEKNEFVPDLNPSDNIEEYVYEVCVKNSKYVFRFTDLPGEVFSPKRSGEDIKITELREKLPKIVAKNHVLMIAIDTPHLMEYPHNDINGICEYHTEFNRSDIITDFIKDNFLATGKIKRKDIDDKLIIFVPLKCEKYLYNGKMKDIPDCVRKGYDDLLSHFASPGPKEKFSSVIDPILTIGGAEFYRFDDDARATGRYNYVYDPALRHYHPQYCDSPMFLILLYMIQIAKSGKQRQNGLVRFFGEKFGKQASLNDLISVENDIKSMLNSNKPEGFDVIQDPIGMGV